MACNNFTFILIFMTTGVRCNFIFHIFSFKLLKMQEIQFFPPPHFIYRRHCALVMKMSSPSRGRHYGGDFFCR